MDAHVLSVNVGTARPIASKSGTTGIDKRPVDARIAVVAPGPKGVGGSGLAGDTICDRENHGGDDQAVYVYAREDLDWWESTLDRPLASGVFGENLTTLGLDVTGARVGEQWRVGGDLVIAVTVPRIPCRTFAVWLAEEGWARTFNHAARPGAYLRVVVPGSVGPDDAITVRPPARP